MRKVLVMVPDLMFGVKIGDVVRALGGTPVDVTPVTLLRHAADADLLVVDSGQLNGWSEAVRALKADPQGASVPVLAFGPHVDVAAQRAALAVGCERVVTRGKLAAELPTLLQATARGTRQPDSAAPAALDEQGSVIPSKGAV
ncbi:MAG: hypothetical protein H0X37_14375 [Herpetosiphonaceae bacterium]|nr:hypothetical protein [Herpetosiphonaceae bacterium]